MNLAKLHIYIVDYLRWISSQTNEQISEEEYRHYETALLNFNSFVSARLAIEELEAEEE